MVIASCGESSDFGFGQRFPVSGTVTYNNQPLEKGQIQFVPEDPKGVGAGGDIENGSYAVGIAGDTAGARPGKYKVTIIAKEDYEAQAKAELERARAKFPDQAKNAGEGFVRIPRELMAKAAREAKSLIPAGYGSVKTTTLTAEVKEQPENKIDFQLSDAGAPPEPKGTAPAKGKGRRDAAQSKDPK